MASSVNKLEAIVRKFRVDATLKDPLYYEIAADPRLLAELSSGSLAEDPIFPERNSLKFLSRMSVKEITNNATELPESWKPHWKIHLEKPLKQRLNVKFSGRQVVPTFTFEGPLAGYHNKMRYQRARGNLVSRDLTSLLATANQIGMMGQGHVFGRGGLAIHSKDKLALINWANRNTGKTMMMLELIKQGYQIYSNSYTNLYVDNGDIYAIPTSKPAAAMPLRIDLNNVEHIAKDEVLVDILNKQFEYLRRLQTNLPHDLGSIPILTGVKNTFTENPNEGIILIRAPKEAVNLNDYELLWTQPAGVGYNNNKPLVVNPLRDDARMNLEALSSLSHIGLQTSLNLMMEYGSPDRNMRITTKDNFELAINKYLSRSGFTEKQKTVMDRILAPGMIQVTGNPKNLTDLALSYLARHGKMGSKPGKFDDLF